MNNQHIVPIGVALKEKKFPPSSDTFNDIGKSLSWFFEEIPSILSKNGISIQPMNLRLQLPTVQPHIFPEQNGIQSYATEKYDIFYRTDNAISKEILEEQLKSPLCTKHLVYLIAARKEKNNNQHMLFFLSGVDSGGCDCYFHHGQQEKKCNRTHIIAANLPQPLNNEYKSTAIENIIEKFYSSAIMLMKNPIPSFGSSTPLINYLTAAEVGIDNFFTLTCFDENNNSLFPVGITTVHNNFSPKTTTCNNIKQSITSFYQNIAIALKELGITLQPFDAILPNMFYLISNSVPIIPGENNIKKIKGNRCAFFVEPSLSLEKITTVLSNEKNKIFLSFAICIDLQSLSTTGYMVLPINATNEFGYIHYSHTQNKQFVLPINAEKFTDDFSQSPFMRKFITFYATEEQQLAQKAGPTYPEKIMSALQFFQKNILINITIGGNEKHPFGILFNTPSFPSILPEITDEKISFNYFKNTLQSLLKKKGINISVRREALPKDCYNEEGFFITPFQKNTQKKEGANGITLVANKEYTFDEIESQLYNPNVKKEISFALCLNDPSFNSSTQKKYLILFNSPLTEATAPFYLHCEIKNGIPSFAYCNLKVEPSMLLNISPSSELIKACGHLYQVGMLQPGKGILARYQRGFSLKSGDEEEKIYFNEEDNEMVQLFIKSFFHQKK